MLLTVHACVKLYVYKCVYVKLCTYTRIAVREIVDICMTCNCISIHIGEIVHIYTCKRCEIVGGWRAGAW